jgi:hypothetical protein
LRVLNHLFPSVLVFLGRKIPAPDVFNVLPEC